MFSFLNAEPKKSFVSSLSQMGWYSSDSVKLSAELDGYLKKSKTNPIEGINALILPHAGYRFSGQAAIDGVKHIQNRLFKRVIVLGPTHHVAMRNQASILAVTHYETPLGEIECDVKAIQALLKTKPFMINQKAHDQEHSVQIELPLLQKAGVFQSGAKLIPVVVGQLDMDGVNALAVELLKWVDGETLIVVSSDFTHFGSRFGYVPFTEDVPANIKKLDMGAYQHIANGNAQGLLDYCKDTGATICGENPIALLLAMMTPESTSHLMTYTTSGELTGDWENSVSYLSVAFDAKWRTKINHSSVSETLSQKDKGVLLQLARKTIEHYLKNETTPTAESLGISVTEGMKSIMGAFVTLKKRGQLRGCIGEIIPHRPLYQAVIDQAINSTVNDNRFPPVTSDEIPDLEIEISALTPSHQIASYQDFVIGKHGIILQKSGRSAVFLPQVAPEQGWDTQTTLTQLALKAGLPADAWTENCDFFVFEAIVFH